MLSPHFSALFFTYTFLQLLVAQKDHMSSPLRLLLDLQISFGPISWLMVSEIFPLRVRGRALSLATLVNFGSNALVSFALPTVQVRVLAEGR